MKKSLATAALVATFAAISTTSYADELPIRGECTKDGETVTFTGSRMPIQDRSTGDFGVTQIFMSLQDYDLMLAPNVQRLQFAPDENGLVPAAIGQLTVEVGTDPVNNTGTLRASSDTFDIYFEGHYPDNGRDFNGWVCDITPYF